jgi:hypothetical protein
MKIIVLSLGIIKIIPDTWRGEVRKIVTHTFLAFKNSFLMATIKMRIPSFHLTQGLCIKSFIRTSQIKAFLVLELVSLVLYA